MTPSELTSGIMHTVLYGGWTVFAVLFLWRGWRSGRERRVVRKAPRAKTGIGFQAIGFAIVWGVRRVPTTPIVPGLPIVDILVTLIVVALIAASITLIMLAVRQLGRQWAVQARTIEDHKLVTEGPYAVVRHPIYLGIFGFFLATGLTLTAWWPLLVASVAFLVGTTIRVRAEDALLLETFGGAFERYRQRVPALIPWGGGA